MFNLKDIEEITKGKIINGNFTKLVKKYSISNTNFDKGIFYVPIIFKGNDREENIINAVKNGAMGFMINKNSINYEKIIDEAKQIDSEICILAV